MGLFEICYMVLCLKWLHNAGYMYAKPKIMQLIILIKNIYHELLIFRLECFPSNCTFSKSLFPCLASWQGGLEPIQACSLIYPSYVFTLWEEAGKPDDCAHVWDQNTNSKFEGMWGNSSPPCGALKPCCLNCEHQINKTA